VGRQSSLLDLTWNSVGSTIGVLFGLIISHSSHRFHRGNRTALFVLICWLTYLLFPFLPVVAGPALDAKFAAFLRSDWVSLVSCFASWYVTGFLLKEAGVRRVNFWLVRSIALVLVQMFLPGRHPSVAGLFGAILGTSLFVYTRQLTPVWPLLLTLVVRGLAPFHFQSPANAFAWVPFAPVVEGVWITASLVLLEKLYYYAATIWALAAAGLRLRNAAFITAALLVVIETAQLHLPGRTPETTDPVVALLLGIVFDTLKRTSIPSETSA
jgi:VanZ family protein